MKSARLTGNVVALASLAVVVGANALLLRQNLQIRSALFPDYSGMDLPEPGQILPLASQAGLESPPAAAEALGRQRMIFLFFDPRCRFSRAQFPYWRGLIEDSGAAQVFGVVPDRASGEAVGALLREFKAEGLKLLRISEELREASKLRITPMTLVADGEGRITHRWVGRWDIRTPQEAASLLGPSR